MQCVNYWSAIYDESCHESRWSPPVLDFDGKLPSVYAHRSCNWSKNVCVILPTIGNARNNLCQKIVPQTPDKPLAQPPLVRIKANDVKK